MVKSTETEYLLELARRQGVACASVSDGHVLVFKRDKLESLLNDKTNDSDVVVIFVKSTSSTGLLC